MKLDTILDKFISKQLVEIFLLGIVIFTTIMFASDTFLSLVKQITSYGIPFRIAFIILILKLPSILVLTIPMGVLLSTIITINKLSINSEVTAMRACGISITRLAFPVLIFGTCAGLLSFTINEFITPAANIQAQKLSAWALMQKNIPEGKNNFSFKELDKDGKFKRLFYVDNYNNKKLNGITVLDMSKKDATQIVQSKYGNADQDGWSFEKGVIYTVSNSGNILNTTVFDKLNLFSGFYSQNLRKISNASELNFFKLAKYIEKNKHDLSLKKSLDELIIELNEKLAIPITCVLVALIGVPLAITKPRARFNRGTLFSVVVIFCYYVIRSFSISLGEAHVLNPVLSAWLPNLIIIIIGSIMFYRKAYQT